MPKESKKSGGGIRWRRWLAGLAFAAVGVSTAMAGLKVRDFALTDPQFTFSRERQDSLQILGLGHASRAKVARVFASDFEHSIFSIPLEERRRRLLAVDWVEDATVSRIWPDRIVVHIRERKPVAFVFFRAGVLLIDSRGVLLEPPAQAQFTYPVLSGVGESETESQRRDRVRCLLRVQEELGPQFQDISEVNATDPENIRVIIQVTAAPSSLLHANAADTMGPPAAVPAPKPSTVELILGYNGFASRYRNFLKHFPEIQRSSPGARTFDLRLDDRILAED
jgi:cell division protein FtsQ